MQANGGCVEDKISSAEDVASPNINSSSSGQMPDISAASSAAQQHHNQTQSVSQASSKANLINQVPTTAPGQLQQPKPVVSPVSGHQQQSSGSMSNSGSASGISAAVASGGNNFVNPEQAASVHSQNSGNMMYPRQQRQGHYHNQHYNQSNHHHHQNSKYNNSNNNHKGDNESNHVILITVINPHYPITCDLIHQICSTYGKVNRIVIFKKNGVQAMVEFDNIESAKRAKSSLQNCDIYSGCCTLRVEIAKPVRLNVHKNDSESFDYTNPNLGTGNGGANAGSIQSGTSEIGGQTGDHHHNPQTSSSSSTYGSTRGGGGVNSRRHGGDLATGPLNNAGGGHQHASQFQPGQHMHSQDNQKQQQSNPSASSHQATAYIMGQPIEPQQAQSNADSNEPMDTFQHPDAGFNVSRGAGGGGGGGSSSGGGGNGPANFVGLDPFMPSGPHGMPNNMYQRQDGSGGGGPQHHHHPHHPSHHHHHHHHHQRVGLAGSGSNSGSGPHHNAAFPSINASNSLMAGPANMSPQGTVMMVYGLSADRINCDRLFNLFCLYGNVMRVKFLRSKEGCAMVQMGDVMAVDRCVSSLNKITLFGNELQISYSKQAFLHDVLQPFALPDGSPSFKDFMGNKNNRFKNPEVASKNRILPPSRVLHFFNAPHGITEDELVHLIKQTTEHEPVSVKIFTPKAENVKSYSGLVTFGDPAEATEALVLCNHISMPKAGVAHPYILRLCFSPPTYC